MIPMVTQVGYAVGLFFLIPLGDYIERQRLILRQAQVLFLAMIGMMLSQRRQCWCSTPSLPGWLQQ